MLSRESGQNSTARHSEEDRMLMESQAVAISLNTVLVGKYPGSLGASNLKDHLLAVFPEAENMPVTMQSQPYFPFPVKKGLKKCNQDTR